MNSPSGWYQDPFADGERYWDGTNWTSETRPNQDQFTNPTTQGWQPPFQQSQNDRDQYSQDQYSQDQYGQDRYGQNPVQHDPYAQGPFSPGPTQRDQYQPESYQPESYQQESYQQESYQQDVYQTQPPVQNEWMRTVEHDQQGSQVSHENAPRGRSRGTLPKGPFGKKALLGLVMVVVVVGGLMSTNSKPSSAPVITGGIPASSDNNAATDPESSEIPADEAVSPIAETTDSGTEGLYGDETTVPDPDTEVSGSPTPATSTTPTPKTTTKPTTTTVATPKPTIKSTPSKPKVSFARGPEFISTIWSQDTLIVSWVAAKQPTGVRMTSHTVTVSTPGGHRRTITTRESVLNVTGAGAGCTVKIVTHTTAGDSKPTSASCSTRTL